MRYCEPLKLCANQKLINDFNAVLYSIKVHLYCNEIEAKAQPFNPEVLQALRGRHPLPSVSDLEALQARVNDALKQDVAGRKD